MCRLSPCLIAIWFAVAGVGAAQQVAGNLLVDVKVSDLAPGVVTSWTNNGTLGGSFTAVNDPQVITDVQNTGHPGVWFDWDSFWGPVAPAEITGGSDRTIEVWAYNLERNSEHCLVDLSRRDGAGGSHFAFCWGDWWLLQGWAHGDTGWDVSGGSAPSAGAWHHLVITYDSSHVLRAYSDGTLVAQRDLSATPLDTLPDYNIAIGSQRLNLSLPTSWDPNPPPGGRLGLSIDWWNTFFGYMSGVRIHDGALSDAQVAANYNSGMDLELAHTVVRPVGDLLPTSASLNGELLSVGTGGNPDVWVCYGTTHGGADTSAWQNVELVGTVLAAGSVAKSVTGLTPGTHYVYSFYAENSSGASWSDAAGQFIAPAPPAIENYSASEVITTAATANGQLVDDKNLTTSVHIYYGKTDGGTNAGSWDVDLDLGVRGNGPIAQTLGSLDDDTDYFYRFFAVNSEGGVWAGTTIGFHTLALTPPEIANSAPGSVRVSTARARGVLSSTNFLATTVTLYHGATDGGTNALGWDVALDLGTQGVGSFDILLTGLAGTHYYRFYAESQAGGTWAATTETITLATPFGGFSDGYAKRLPITVSGYSGTEELLDFPLLVELDESAIPGFQYADADPVGADLRFTTTDGAELSYDLDTWNPAGSSFVWVKVPVLQTNAQIRMYYGKSGDTAPSYTTDGSTWSENYVAAWHMTNKWVRDATGQGRDAEEVFEFGGDTITPVSGKIGDALRFPRNAGGSTIITKNIKLVNQTLSAWVWSDDLADRWGCIMTKPGVMYFMSNVYAPGNYRFETAWWGWDVVTPVPGEGSWHYVVATADGTGDFAGRYQSLYVDGELKASWTKGGTEINPGWIPQQNEERIRLGGEWDNNRVHKGNLDELHMANVPRSADWIKAEFDNQSSPVAFLTYEAVERADGVFLENVAIEGGSVSATSATLRVDLNASDGSESDVTLYLNVGADGGVTPGGWTYVSPAVPESNGVVTRALTGLLPDVTYSFRFYATNSSLAMARWSAAGSFATALTPSSMPEDLKARASETSVYLTWIDRSNTETGFVVEWYRHDLGVTNREVVTSSPFVHAGLVPQTYSYRVSATNSANGSSSGFTGWVSATPTGPVDPVADAVYRMRISFEQYSGSALANFPVLVALAEGTRGFHHEDAMPGGTDLRFTAADGTALLSSEIDEWAVEGARTYAWVKIPVLDNTTVIWAFWGSGDEQYPASQANGDVWSEGFVGVWHMSEAAALDSSGSGKHGTPTGAYGTTAGSVGKAQVCPGAGSHIDVGDVDVAPDLTMEAYYYTAPGAPVSKYAISKWDSYRMNQENVDWLWFHIWGDNLYNNYQLNQGFIWEGQWHHVAMTYAGSSGLQSTYVDGVSWGSNALGSNPIRQNDNATWLAENYLGTFDEVRLSNVARSGDWVAASAQCMSDNASLVTYGLAEPFGPVRLVDAGVSKATITVSSATLFATLEVDGASNADVRVYWQAGSDGGITTGGWANAGTSAAEATGIVTRTLSGLSGDTVYFARFYAESAALGKSGWSGPIEFRTKVDQADLPFATAGDLLIWLRPREGVTVDVDGLAQWANYGTLEGFFSADVGRAPTYGAVEGIPCASFDGADRMRASFVAPTNITGNSDYSVEMWVYNAAVAGEETILSWSRRGGPDGSNAQFIYGNNAAWGAIGHWGGWDMGFDGGVPVAGGWHHLVMTYSGAGGVERVYVNGLLNAEEGGKTLSIWNGFPVALGSGYWWNDGQNFGWDDGVAFSGSLAALRVHDGELTAEQVAGNYLVGPDASTPLVVNDTASDVTATAATLHGALLSTGTVATAVSLYYGTNDGGANAGAWDESVLVGSGMATGAVSVTISNLAEKTVYYYRFHAENTTGSSWGVPTASFKTLGSPEIVALAAESVLSGSAYAIGRLVATNGSAVTVTLYWGENDGGMTTNWPHVVELGAVLEGQELVAGLAGLQPQTSYAYRFRATSGNGIGWTDPVQTFTTAARFDNSGYAYRLKIPLDWYEKAETLIGFQLLVKLGSSVAGFDYSGFSQPGSPADLRFTDATGSTELKHEIDKWNPSGDSFVWVRLPALHSASSHIWAYWGKSVDRLPSLAAATDINDCVVWMKADAVDMNDVATEVRLDGANVYVKRWDDQTGNGNHASQGTDSDQPQYIPSALNGLPALRFVQDNEDWGDRLQLGDLSAQFPAGATLFAVATINNDGRYNLFGNRGNNDERWRADTWGESKPGSFRGSRSDAFTMTSWPTTGSHVFALESDNRLFRCVVDGTVIGRDAPQYNNGAGWDWTIGNRANGGQALNGDIAEVILYNRVLTRDEVRRVGNYLAEKYGVSASYDLRVAPAYTEDGSVWSAEHVAVWHMNEKYVKDSTANANDAMEVYEADPITVDPGIIGNSLSFADNGGGATVITRDIRLTNQTLSAWVLCDDLAEHWGTIMAKGEMWFMSNVFSPAHYRFETAPWGWDVVVLVPDAGEWHYVVATADGEDEFAGRYQKLFVDGVEMASWTKTEIPYQNAERVRIGGWWNDGNRTHRGDLDELRMTRVARSPDWIWGEWRNQSDAAPATRVEELKPGTLLLVR